MVHTVVKGIPVRHYTAEVILTPAGEGTNIRWLADRDRPWLAGSSTASSAPSIHRSCRI